MKLRNGGTIIMNADSATKLDEAVNHGDSSGVQREVAGRAVETATHPVKAVTGSREKSSVRGIKRRVSRGARGDGEQPHSEESQPPLPIGRGEAASDAAAAEGASLSNETATLPSGSTE